MADTVNIPAPDLNGPQIASNVNFMDKYSEERDKRYKVGGRSYIDPAKSDKFKHFLKDPWIKNGTPINRPMGVNGHSKFLILGAGFGGILFAVKLIQAGFDAKDIVIVDPAGGFGGTWYWNRYPGLMCDTESYIYLPMLEEMNYMPKRKYSGGEEIRQYAESIAKAFGLQDRAQFQASMQSATWNEEAKQWSVGIVEKPKGGDEVQSTIRADFVMFASGVLNNAKLPDIEGLDVFKGHSFHTSRWDYGYTGGSIREPDLDKLKDKRIAYVGTGATAVQAVPELARWGKELYVFQRTPSAVDIRDNRETDPQEWKAKIAGKQGWQRERHANYHAFICNVPEKPKLDLVDDAWTKM
ncbi:hypothetical protein LTS14_006018 [Recurvomyces mirabilis]|nr:hypothetical protein LTS14_006018 [Recurvomyces mirabilis]